MRTPRKLKTLFNRAKENSMGISLGALITGSIALATKNNLHPPYADITNIIGLGLITLGLTAGYVFHSNQYKQRAQKTITPPKPMN